MAQKVAPHANLVKVEKVLFLDHEGYSVADTEQADNMQIIMEKLPNGESGGSSILPPPRAFPKILGSTPFKLVLALCFTKCAFTSSI